MSNPIKAVLQAVEEVLTGALALPSEAVGIRNGGDGKPAGAYKGGGWFAGIYFAGMNNTPNTEMTGKEREISIGVDLTRVLAKVPSAKRGAFMLNDEELIQRALDIDEAILAGDGIITAACNAKMIPFADKECFYEDFSTGDMQPPRSESPEWLLQEPDVNQALPIWVVSMRFSGLKYVKPFRGSA